MKSLELLEELNKILIEADKRCDLVYKEVGEQDKIKSDLEHELINNYPQLSAKEKREYTDELFKVLAERHNYKYEYRELEILKELRNVNGLENAFNNAINKLRKLNQEIETPIYYKRADKNKGEIIVAGGNEEGNN